MVYISTVAVVGEPHRGEIIDEETVCHPKDDYQKSKYAAERLILEMIKSRNLPGVILRPGAFYGPGSRYGFNRLFIEEPMRGWRIQIDNGRHFTFPIFVPDVPPAILKTLKTGTPGEIYNISDRSFTHAELNHLISPLLGISTWRLNVPSFLMVVLAAIMELISKITRREPFYPLNLRHYVFSDWRVRSGKARLELGFEPTSIEEGLRKTVAWYKEGGWKK
jgi:dihydroflavonol-4-reductase